MSSVGKAESPEHKKLVKGLIDYLNQQGFKTICAASEGFKECDPREGRIPDVVGENAQELRAIGEVKTCDDLDNDRTNDQFKIFSNRIMTSGNSKDKDVPFYIGIPKSCVTELQQNLKKLGLEQKTNIHIIFF